MANESCPNCGMEREQWPNPQGVQVEGETYCCEGCADGSGCTCEPSETGAQARSASQREDQRRM